MAFYVLLLKEEETSEWVQYRYGPNEAVMGRIRLDKMTGEASEVEPLPVGNAQALFVRATMKLRQHWRNGSFPAETCWAS